MLKDIFQKKRRYATIPSEKTKRDIPDGLMAKCAKCGTIQYSKELEKNLKVCPACGFDAVFSGADSGSSVHRSGPRERTRSRNGSSGPCAENASTTS